MERLAAAFERHRKQRSGPGAETAPRGSSKPESRRPIAREPERIVYTQTRTVSLSPAVLRERRVILAMGESPYVDAYKILRTQVMHRMKENRWNVLAVTSAGEREGKTLTAVNLALTLALDTTLTVLLVDADLRHPGVHEVLGLPAGRGLADHLLDGTPLSELLVHPGVERVVVLPGGRRVGQSAETLSSPKMVALVEEMKHRYPDRIVIFDLPPVLDVADVLAFAPYTDAALLVVEEGRTDVRQVEHALHLLKGASPVIGTVLNKALGTAASGAETAAAPAADTPVRTVKPVKGGGKSAGRS